VRFETDQQAMQKVFQTGVWVSAPLKGEKNQRASGRTAYWAFCLDLLGINWVFPNSGK
jgi:hypothetical protein